MLSKTEKRGEEKDLETHGRAWFRNNTSATEHESCQFSFISALEKKKKKKKFSTKGAFWEQVTSLCLKWKKGH